METTNGLNGHANGLNGHAKKSLIETIPEHEHSKTQSSFAGPRYVRVLDLVRDAVDLDFRLKATMNEIDKEMREMGNGDLPAILVTLMQRHQQAIPQAPPARVSSGPSVVKAAPHKGNAGERKQAPLKNRGGKLKVQIMGLMADGIERRSKNIVAALKRTNNPNSVYSILSDLVEEKHLIRTKFEHYRLKMRQG